MDRKLIYPGQLPLETDLLGTNLNVMVAMGRLVMDLLGSSTLVSGLACTPTAPASLKVNIGAGAIYSLQNVDGTAYSSLPANTADQIMKQGIQFASDNLQLTMTAPTTPGYSIIYLVQAAFSETDAGSTVLNYYNADNPAVPYSGPNNSNTPNTTVRAGRINIQAKAGVAGTSPSVPAADTGFVPLYQITVAYAQTAITAGNITVAAGAPFLTTLPNVAASLAGYAKLASPTFSGAVGIRSATNAPLYLISDQSGKTAAWNMQGDGNLVLYLSDGTTNKAIVTCPAINGPWNFQIPFGRDPNFYLDLDGSSNPNIVLDANSGMYYDRTVKSLLVNIGGQTRMIMPLTGNLDLYSSTGSAFINNKLIWNIGNQGAGSGMDTDLMWGVPGSSYARRDLANNFAIAQTAPKWSAVSAGVGGVALESTTAANTGYVGFYGADGNRKGYIGFQSTVGGATGPIAYHNDAGTGHYFDSGTAQFGDKALFQAAAYFGANTNGARIAGSGNRLSFYNDTSSNERMAISQNDGAVNIFGARVTAGSDTQGSGALKVIAPQPGGVVVSTYDTQDYTALQFMRQVSGSQNQIGTISVTNVSVSYNTSSDYRLKTDIQPIDSPLDKIAALKPCNFEWISTGTRVDGFLAHELGEVIPEAVTGEKDAEEDIGTATPPAPAEGEEQTAQPLLKVAEGQSPEGWTWTKTGTRPVYQGVDQSKLTPLLTAALQEAHTLLVAQAADIAELKAAVAALTAPAKS